MIERLNTQYKNEMFEFLQYPCLPFCPICLTSKYFPYLESIFKRSYLFSKLDFERVESPFKVDFLKIGFDWLNSTLKTIFSKLIFEANHDLPKIFLSLKLPLSWSTLFQENRFSQIRFIQYGAKGVRPLIFVRTI